MDKVVVKIGAPLLFCDESILEIDLGNGYKIIKAYVDDLPYKKDIIDGYGQLIVDYYDSARIDENGTYLFCLIKEDFFNMKDLSILADDDSEYTELNDYEDNERDYLYKAFSLLRLFHEGNVGPKAIFYDYEISRGIMNKTIHNTDISDIRNITDSRLYSLSDSELIECKRFYAYYFDDAYNMLKAVIDEFIWGLEQSDIATGFEQFTTALEMVLLSRDQHGKKEALSKRIAVMLGDSHTEIRKIYLKIKTFYKLRSASLHEGNEENISDKDLKQMEMITRCVLKDCLAICKQRYNGQDSVSWDEIKRDIIFQLKQKVKVEDEVGTFGV